MIKDTKFCDGGKAYCINTPRAVRPLWNYFANSEYHSKFSQTGQGESRAFAPREKTVSREGRYFYIKTKGKCYNPNYIPLNVMPESYECRHRAGHSEITSTTDNITTKRPDSVFLNQVNFSLIYYDNVYLLLTTSTRENLDIKHFFLTTYYNTL